MKPPRLSQWIVRMSAAAEDRRYVLDDLAAEFDRLIAAEGPRRAKAWYRRQALTSIRPLLLTRHLAATRAWRASALANDFRQAGRWLRRHPALSTVVIGTLASAFAVCLAALIVADSALIRPLPYREPEQLVSAWITGPARPTTVRAVSTADFNDIRDRSQSFTALVAYTPFAMTLTGRGDAREVEALRVSHALEGVLAEAPAAGRFFSSDEFLPGAGHVVMLSHGFWQREFGGRPSAVGESLVLNEVSHEIVGVVQGHRATLPADDHEVLVPLIPRPSAFWENSRASGWLNTLGRLKPGVSMVMAQEELTSIARALEKEEPGSNTGRGEGRVALLLDDLTGPVAPALLLLSAAVIAMLLIAVGNVFNLLQAAASRRRVEFAVRSSLGARGRLAGQVLFEHFILCGTAGVIAVLAAPMLARSFLSISPLAIPGVVNGGVPGLGMTACGVLVLILTVVLTIPHMIAGRRMEESTSLRVRATTPTRREAAFRGALVALQMALSLVLVAGSAAFVRTADRLASVDVGFRADDVLTLTATPSPGRYKTPEAALRYYRDALDAIRRVPGVQSAGSAVGVPLTSGGWQFSMRRPTDQANTLIAVNLASDGYFETIGTRVLAGRLLTPEEQFNGAAVIVINEPFGRFLAGEQSAVGMKLPYSGREWEIVGVVEGARQRALRRPSIPEFYLPWGQAGSRPQTFVARTAADPMGLAPAIVAALRQVDPATPVAKVVPLSGKVNDAMRAELFRASLLATLAAVAVLLAGLGAYGVTAHVVESRIPEYGIRLALGETRGSIVWRALRSAVAPTVVGVVIGVALMAGTGGRLTTFMFDTNPRDVRTLVVAAVSLLALSILAGLRTARIAARADITALRDST
jgi:putative ABC transport system permease protein